MADTIREEGPYLTRVVGLPQLDLSGISGLASISCFYAPEDVGIARTVECRTSVGSWISANTTTLRSLETEASWATQLPLQIIHNLTHLDLRQGKDSPADEESQISRVLCHASRLSSLVVRGTDIKEMMKVVADDQGLCRFSQLVDLNLFPSLQYGALLDDSSVNVVANVLANLPHLRRLQLRAHCNEQSNTVGLLAAIQHHCRLLEAFGLRINRLEHGTTFSDLASALPPSLQALSIDFPSSPALRNLMDHHRNITQDFVRLLIAYTFWHIDGSRAQLSKLGKLPRFGFLHFTVNDGIYSNYPHLSAPTVARQIPTLRIIMVGNAKPSVWSVERCAEEVTLKPWSKYDVYYRNLEGFPIDCPGGEWLVRYAMPPYY
jgi:hypothetical protein